MALNISTNSTLTDYEATSTSSNTMVGGAKTFTIQTGKKFSVGDIVECKPVGAKLSGGFRMTLTAADPVAGTITATGIHSYSYDTPVWATTIAAGTITTVTNPGLSLVAGDAVRLVRRTVATTFAAGTVTSYNSTTGDLVFTTTSTGGSGSQTDLVLVSDGTFSNWQVTYAENDTININGKAKLTITSSTKVPLGIFYALDRGTVEITNTSTSSLLTVTKSMYAHTNFDYFQAQSNWVIKGDYIQIGTGDNTAGQTISLSAYNIDIPSYIEVETASGSGVYRQVYISIDSFNDLSEGLYLPTEPENWGTGSYSDDTYYQGNICWYDTTTKIVRFGDGVNGNKIPTGSKIRMPNIYINQQRAYTYAAADATAVATTLQILDSTLFSATTGNIHCKNEGITFSAKPTATSLTIARAQRQTTASTISKGDKVWLHFIMSTSGNYRQLRVTTDAGGKIDFDVVQFGNYGLLYIYNPQTVTIKNTGAIGWVYPQYSAGDVTLENVIGHNYHYFGQSITYPGGVRVAGIIGKVNIKNIYGSSWGENNPSAGPILHYLSGLPNLQSVSGVFSAATPGAGIVPYGLQVSKSSFTDTTKQFENVVTIGGNNITYCKLNFRAITFGMRPNQTPFVMMQCTADSTTDTFTITSFQAGSQKPYTGCQVRIFSGTAPTGLATATYYFMIRVSDTQFKLATTYYNAKMGVAIDFTTNGASLRVYTAHDTNYGIIAAGDSSTYTKIRQIGASCFSYAMYGDYLCQDMSFYDVVLDGQEWMQYFVYYAGSNLTIANATLGKLTNANTRGSTTAGQNGGVNITTAGGVTLDNVRTTWGTAPLTGSTYGMTYASTYNVQMVSVPSMYYHATAAVVNNATDTGPMYNLLDDPATTGKISVGGFGLNKNRTGVVTTGTAYLDNAGRVYLPTTADTAIITNQIPLKGITSFQNIATTVQSTNPTYLDYTFRVKTPTGAWSTAASLTGANLSTALSSLSGYNSNVGFYLEITVTANNTSATTRLDFLRLATNTDTNYQANDAYLTPEGVDATDIVECRLISDNSLIGSTIGNTRLDFPASGNYGVTAYLVRKTSTGVEVMRTQRDPFTIKYGNNGTFALYTGNQIQIADGSNLPANVWSYPTRSTTKPLLNLGSIIKPL